jgi:apolipoprotein N-acyltransferase
MSSAKRPPAQTRRAAVPGGRAAVDIGLALGAGLLWAISFWPYDLGWAAWFALAPLIYAIHDDAPTRAFLKGWLFGTAAWAVGMHWFAGTVAQIFQVPPAAGLFLFLLFCMMSGVMFGLWTWGVALVAPGLSRRTGLSTAAAEAAFAVPLFVVIDAYFPMLFPSRAANTQFFHLPAVQSAELFGTSGLCWLVAGFNAALALAARRSSRRAGRLALAVAAGAALLNEGYGRLRIREVDAQVRRSLDAGASLRVALIQGDVPDPERFDPARLVAHHELYNQLMREASAQGPLDLIVWPENTYERLIAFPDGDGEFARPEIEGRPLEKAIAADVARTGADVLLGAVAASPNPSRPYYAAVLVGRGGDYRGLVGKRDRTPLSESLPFGDEFPVIYRLFYRVFPRWTSFLTAGPHRLLTTSGGARLGVYICYESVLEAGAREYARAGAQLLINPGNDYFAAGPEPEESLRLGALRAVENRRFLLRAAGSGISAVIDPVGRVVARVPYGERGSLVATVALLDGSPPRGAGSAALALLAVAVCALSGAAAFAPRRR